MFTVGVSGRSAFRTLPAQVVTGLERAREHRTASWNVPLLGRSRRCTPPSYIHGALDLQPSVTYAQVSSHHVCNSRKQDT